MLRVLEQAGCEVLAGEREVTIRGPVRPAALNVVTEPFPGFPTDMQAQIMALCAVADGTSTITDTIYVDRFSHVPELVRLGADVRMQSNVAIVKGVERLSGAPVMATDIRASAALVLAALVAEGETQDLAHLPPRPRLRGHRAEARRARGGREAHPGARGVVARRMADALRRTPRRAPPAPPPAVPAKRYDRAYFERWYRDPRYRASTQGVLVERKVRLALAAAEYLLERPMRTVLDVGCGEGAVARACSRALRPGVRYTGVDSSEYAVRRFGRRAQHPARHRFGALGRARPRRALRPDRVLRRAPLRARPTRRAAACSALARLLGGVAFIEVFAKEDATEGDQEGLQQRPAVTYRRLFREAGLIPLGLHCYAGRMLRRELTTFERGGGSVR